CGRGTDLPCAKPKDCPGCTTRSPIGPAPVPPKNRVDSRSAAAVAVGPRLGTACWYLLILFRTWKPRLRILEDDINRDNSVRSLHQVARLYIEGEQIVPQAIPKVT